VWRAISARPPQRAERPSAARVLALLTRPAALRSVFQPIVALHGGAALGHEALLRLPGDAGFAHAGAAFAAAAQVGLLVELEEAALARHLETLDGSGLAPVFLNVSAASLGTARDGAARLQRQLRAAGLRPEDVVLELTELVRVADAAALADTLEPLRAWGVRLAVDDFGAGFADVRLLLELHPDYVKLDRTLVAGAGAQPRKRALLEALAGTAARLGCLAVAEGLESLDDVRAVTACGIAYGQGFALAPPAPLAAPRAALAGRALVAVER
jgi:EAL domain-containing protein (putative c-di-GMP-specific phosphodiesterase class I)